MPAAFRSVTSGTDPVAGNPTPAAPAGVAADDILLAVLNCEDNATAVVTPATGWAQILFDEGVGTGQQLMSGTYWLRYNGSNYTNNWTISAGGAARFASIYAASGCITTGNPWNGTPVLTLGSDSTAEYGTVTTTKNGCLLVALETVYTWSGAVTPTGGWVQRLDQTTAGPAAIHDFVQPVAGASPTLVVSGDANWAAHILALEPAVEPDPPAVYRVNFGAKVITGVTTVAIAYPAALAANDQIFAFRSMWESSVTATNEAGWTSLGELGGGTGTAADAHTTKIRGDRKDTVAGSESGTVTFDQGGTAADSGVVGIMIAYRLGEATDTWDIASSTGDDATHGTNRSITASTSTPLDVDDVVVVAVATDTDVALVGFASPAITASGITFGPTHRFTSGVGTTTGDDGNIELFEATVTAGSGTAALVMSFTTTSSQCGPGLFVRLRGVPTTPAFVAQKSLITRQAVRRAASW